MRRAPKRSHTDEATRARIALYVEDHPDQTRRQVAKRFNVHPNTVTHACRENDLPIFARRPAKHATV